jgi:HD-GYP domain-containing protein (c-di-GMP phosphodiesterase class II)
VEHAAAQCAGSAWLARVAGFPSDEVAQLATICERWDGVGQPAGLQGEAVPVAVRLYRPASQAAAALYTSERRLL